MKKTNVLSMVELALFSALIFLMAFTPFIGYIPLGFTRATIIHIPVIIGSIMLGPVRGGFLGLLFGLTSLINNTINPTATSFVFSPFYSLGDVHGNFFSLIICFVPRILVGVVPHFVYKWLKKPLGQSPSLVLAGLLGSLTNTILVMHMILLFFGKQYAMANQKAYEAIYAFILSIIGINGVPEAIVAAILTLIICKALLAVKKKNDN